MFDLLVKPRAPFVPPFPYLKREIVINMYPRLKLVPNLVLLFYTFSTFLLLDDYKMVTLLKMLPFFS